MTPDKDPCRGVMSPATIPYMQLGKGCDAKCLGIGVFVGRIFCHSEQRRREEKMFQTLSALMHHTHLRRF